MGDSRVFVETTLPCVPLPSVSQREPIRTERLMIRCLGEDDLQSYHELRSQPEAMTGSRLGRPDRDIEESRSALDDFLPKNADKKFLFGAFLASTGELIGEGGVHTLKSSSCGWPEIGYRFRKEFWGQGYATEFLRAFLEAWWDLPRSHTRLEVHPLSIRKASETEAVGAIEQIHANTDVWNIGSQKVLEKVGFTRFSEWTEPDTQEHRLGQPLPLVGYILPSPKRG